MAFLIACLASSKETTSPPAIAAATTAVAHLTRTSVIGPGWGL